MPKRLAPVVALSALLSCGAPMTSDEPTSGSRLRPRYLVASDGTKVPTFSYYDETLKQDCAFQLQADATWLCLPRGVSQVTDRSPYVSARFE